MHENWMVAGGVQHPAVTQDKISRRDVFVSEPRGVNSSVAVPRESAISNLDGLDRNVSAISRDDRSRG